MDNNQSTKEISKEIRIELKKEFPTAKFSLVSDYNQITVSLMSDNKSPFTNGDLTAYEQLNHYYLDNYLQDNRHKPVSWESTRWMTPEAVEMFKKVTAISNRKNWDKSEIQSDYFNCHYYFSLHIGNWDNEFKVN